MIKIHSTRHVLAVRDLRRATSYFVNVLGFSLDLNDADGWSFVSLGDFGVMLGECPEEVPASETDNHSYFAHVLMEGIDDIYQGYLERGAEIVGEISDKPWGLREFCVRTPEGHRIVFAQKQIQGSRA